MRIRRRAAFTLVELLTVVAIVGLLVAVLIPAISTVRSRGRVTSTGATIATLSTALETFRSDAQCGGEYPPSASDVVQTFGRTGLTYRVQNPYAPANGPPTLPNMPMSGAGLLYWALLGADGLGTAGFSAVRTTSPYWGASTDSRSGGAYEIDAPAGRPRQRRFGPYVDGSAMRVSHSNSSLNVAQDPDYTPPRGQHFEIDVETEAARALGQLPKPRFYPMFLDAFGGPILYFRADAAGMAAVDFSPNDRQADGAGRGVFHYRDNSELLSQREAALVLRPNGRGHPLDVASVSPQNPDAFYPNDANAFDLSDRALAGRLAADFRFAAYVRKESTSRLEAQNSGSYLLISAGEDGLFGTADDVANFAHHGAALSP